MAKPLSRRPPAGPVPSCLPPTTGPDADLVGQDLVGQDLVGQIEAFLRQTVQELAPDPDPTTRGRPRILPAVCLWAGVVVCLLRGETAFVEVWRLLSLHGLWQYPRFGITDQAVYKRLAQDDGSTLRRLFTSLSGALALRLAPLLPLLVPGAGAHLAPWATMVVALDEMALDQVARLLPALRDVPAGATALLPGVLTALFDVRAQQFVRVDHRTAVDQNEKVLARTMVRDLPRGSLILADL